MNTGKIEVILGNGDSGKTSFAIGRGIQALIKQKDVLSEAEKQEECMNIRNGLNYARKVLATGECDLLILDGILKLLGPGILKEEELEQLLDARDEADVILTGNLLPDWLRGKAQRVERIDSE